MLTTLELARACVLAALAEQRRREQLAYRERLAAGYDPLAGSRMLAERKQRDAR